MASVENCFQEKNVNMAREVCTMFFFFLPHRNEVGVDKLYIISTWSNYEALARLTPYIIHSHKNVFCNKFAD